MWYEFSNVGEVDSPALLFYPDRAEENARRMIAVAGDLPRLCPHVKTHKTAELVQMQMALGITKFKCATIAEAEMLAATGAPNVLLAYQLVGPKIQRFIQLTKKFPQTSFAAIADDAKAIRELANAATQHGVRLKILLDIDSGLHRSGVPAGPRAAELYRLMASLPGLEPGGLRVYDGQIEDEDAVTRAKNCDAAFAPVRALRTELADLPVPRIVAGGTLTFPFHARRPGVECSPGTCILWDFAYGASFPDLDFLYAALLLTRVVSKPGDNRLTLDLGHKAIGSEKLHPRVQLLNLADAKTIVHNEEHLVVETTRAHEFAVGDVFYGVPKHVCPTVALHAEAVIIKDGAAVGSWKITARNRKLSV